MTTVTKNFKVPNENKSKGKMRHGMPQISVNEKFIADLDENNIGHMKMFINPNELKPTQSNFNFEKVQGMIDTGNWKKKPIISSSDDFVIDGHHRWLSAANIGKGEKVSSIVVDMTADQILKFMKGKPYVATKTINESLELNENDSGKIDEYIRTQFKGDSNTIGKLYLMKAPNGKPLFYKTLKIFKSLKSQAIWSFGTLEIRKVGGAAYWGIDWNVVNTNRKITPGNFHYMSAHDAQKAMLDLGINVSKLPETSDYLAKPLDAYTVLR